ncbi:hypothetical protein ACIREK_30760 [Streptomyces sp. NPDC102415]|uniref:hypothetical protein n=1 Tax=Streptomyces sp. NPDC102415 TaxID=3366173 RepID=UPI0038296769
MAEFSAPFDGSPIATQSQWSRMARRWGLDGVHADDPGASALKVTGNGTGTVSLAVGEAFVNGFYYKNDATKSISVTANAGSSARIDTVVLRASMSSKTVRAFYRTGGTSAPTLATDENGDYEIPLAQCTVAAGSSVVTAANTLDRRWFTDRGAVTGVPGARRPSSKGQLLVEGTSLYVGDGAGWLWIGSAGQDDSTYTPVWTAGSSTINWGTGAQNTGRYQVRGKRVDVTIQLTAATNPGNINAPLMVSLPPGYPATPAFRSLFTWTYTSAGSQGSGLGSGLVLPDQSTTKIGSLRYALPSGSTSSSTHTITNGIPWDIQTGSILTIDGSYWLA